MHKFTLTNGGRLLAASMLAIQGGIATPAEHITAGNLQARLDIERPKDPNDAWFDEGKTDFELSEKERDLLKRIAEKHSDKLPVGRHSVSILTQLGFVE